MTNQYLTGIIPFTYFIDGTRNAGSTFLRANGLENNSDDFKMFKHGFKYDQLIFQKAYWPEMMTLFQGPKILDLCDPDWINHTLNIIEIASLVDAITCSSIQLTNLILSYLPNKKVYHVPDRLDFKLFPKEKKTHTGPAQEIFWFGFIKNAYETLPDLAPYIIKHNLRLTIVSEAPYLQDDAIKQLNPVYYKYNQYSAYNLLSRADIILNPKSAKSFFKYKSNNKSLISWRLGIPIAETPSDLEKLIIPEERVKQAREMGKLVEKDFNILQSVAQYRAIFEEIRKSS